MATAPPPPAPQLAMACKDAITDVYTLPSGLPAYDSSHRGDVIRCAPDVYLSADQVNALLPAYQYKGAKAKSGFWTYRIAFRTERVVPDGSPAGTPNPEGTSAATLLIPDHPIKNGPLVVFAHGTVGLADACAPTLGDLTKAPGPTGSQQDYPVNLMSMAGYGYAVIMPDYAGFGFNAPPGYFDAQDEAHGVLDASRAAAHLLPSVAQVASGTPIVIVGHSQGGHAALSAQSIVASYGSGGTVVGVAAYAPFWISMAAWGAVTSPLANVTTTGGAGSEAEILYAMNYFYSAGELLDGPGGGVAMYQADKQALAKQVVLSPTCFDAADLAKLGNTPADFFDPTFVQNVGINCAVAANCTDAQSMKWLTRWQHDRPAIDPNGAPVLIWQGMNDKYISVGFEQCIHDKITTDVGATSTQATFCFDANAGHNDIVRLDADYVNQWIAARASVGAEPTAPCGAFPTGQTCQSPPANL